MEEVFEFLEDGIETLVLLQHGLLEMTCGDCNEHIQDMLHCGFKYTEPSEDELYNEVSKKTYSHCPMSTIPKIVYDLYDQYMFVKEFNTPQDPKNTSLLFWWFVKTYNKKTNEIQTYLHEKKMAEMKKRKGKS